MHTAMQPKHMNGGDAIHGGIADDDFLARLADNSVIFLDLARTETVRPSLARTGFVSCAFGSMAIIAPPARLGLRSYTQASRDKVHLSRPTLPANAVSQLNQLADAQAKKVVFTLFQGL